MIGKAILTLDNFSSQSLYKMIGFNVARKRREKELSQLELALAIGLKSSGLISVAELNHNNRHFNVEHLYKISLALECDVSEFFKPIEP